MAVALTGTDVTQIALSSTGSWERRDLDNDYGSLPSDCSGVILVFDAPSGLAIGAREYNNANFTNIKVLDGGSRCTCYVACDSNHEVEIYRGDAATKVYLIGYFTTDATWLSSPIDVTPGATSWQDVDLSAHTSGGEVFAVFEIAANTNRGVSFRYNGDTADRFQSNSLGHHWGIMPLDDNDIIECRVENITAVTIYLVGFITAGTKRTSGGSDLFASLGTGSYQDFTLPDTGKEIALLEIYGAGTVRAFATRPNGDTPYPDIYSDVYFQTDWAIVSIDGSDIAEAKLEDTTIECYCWGYLEDVSSGGGGLLPIIDPADLTEVATSILPSSEIAKTIESASLSAVSLSTLPCFEAGKATDPAGLTSAIASILPANEVGAATDSASLVSANLIPLPGTEMAMAIDAAALVIATATSLTAIVGNSVSDPAQLTQTTAVILPASEKGIALDQGVITSNSVSILISSETAKGIDNAVLVNAQGQPIAALEITSTVDIAELTSVSTTILTAITLTGDEIGAIFGTPVIVPVLQGAPTLLNKLQGTPHIKQE